MSDPTPDPAEGTTPPAETAQEPPNAPAEADAPDDRQERRDARVRAERDALKSDVDSLRGELTRLRRAEVERVAGGRLADPRDLRLLVTDEQVAELYGEDGAVDGEALDELLDDVIEKHPTWARSAVPAVALGPRRTAPNTPAPSWSSVLRRR